MPETDLQKYAIIERFFSNQIFRGVEGVGLPYERDGNARRKSRIKTLKETNLGVAQVLFDP